MASDAQLDPAAIADLLDRALVPERGNLVERPWGGSRLVELAGLPAARSPIGESFELAACPSDDEARAHPSRVRLPDDTTVTLASVLQACPQLLGAAHVHAFGRELPLLPKLLDLASLLSVQTHPADHPEAYVILEADPGATMRIGFRDDIDVDAMADELEAAIELQHRLARAARVPLDEPGTVAAIEHALAGAPLDPVQAWFDLPPGDTRGIFERLGAINRAVLDRMQSIEVLPGMVIHNWAPHPRTGRPTAAVHALGDPDGKAVLALEIRLAGGTLRAWDHARFPMRPVDPRAALAEASSCAIDPTTIVVAVPTGAERFVSVDNGLFRIEHLRPRPTLALACEGVAQVLHCTRGCARIVGPGGPVALDRGRTALVPATWTQWQLESDADDTEVVAARLHVRETRLAARTRSLARVRGVVADSLGPREVLVIANGGDGPLVRERYAALGRELFRADGATTVTVHEELVRRGQLLGLLDAMQAWERERAAAAREGVAIGIMLPGQGTRLSPLTQRLHGIKPFAPMPVRARPDGAWLDAGAASLLSWVGVAHELERLGFRGIAWKWGDEPQFASNDLAALERDLSQCDAVRFGIEVEITDDLARNKEWLLRDGEGMLVAQLRRRPADELRARLADTGVGVDGRALVHIGSPALSFALVDALRGSFGDLDGWLDIDGYLFEALTHDPAAWQAEIARDAGLRELLARCPDFHARAQAVRTRVEAVTGRPFTVAVVDFGADTYWGDMGQLSRAREAFALLGARGDHGEFARRLASLADVVPDRFGNRVVRSAIPDDGSVTDSVVVDSRIGHGRVDDAVVWASELGRAALEPGTVVLDSTCRSLVTAADALVFRAVAPADLQLAAAEVFTTLPADPTAAELVLEPWRVDAGVDPGAPGVYRVRQPGNPGSFADKFVQMRQRTVPPHEIEARITAMRRALARQLPEPPTS